MSIIRNTSQSIFIARLLPIKTLLPLSRPHKIRPVEQTHIYFFCLFVPIERVREREKKRVLLLLSTRRCNRENLFPQKPRFPLSLRKSRAARTLSLSYTHIGTYTFALSSLENGIKGLFVTPLRAAAEHTYIVYSRGGVAASEAIFYSVIDRRRRRKLARPITFDGFFKRVSRIIIYIRFLIYVSDYYISSRAFF